jgi:hypothetical protein
MTCSAVRERNSYATALPDDQNVKAVVYDEEKISSQNLPTLLCFYIGACKYAVRRADVDRDDDVLRYFQN